MDHENADRSWLGKGEYDNDFEVGRNYVSFYLHCGQIGTIEETTAVYNHIIITSPLGARRLMKMLAQALDEYERRFGKIGDQPGQVFSNDEFTHGNQ